MKKFMKIMKGILPYIPVILAIYEQRSQKAASERSLPSPPHSSGADEALRSSGAASSQPLFDHPEFQGMMKDAGWERVPNSPSVDEDVWRDLEELDRLNPRI